jgi:NAD(P)-dependent dehydrogenase (short-subunit alcohol dehydrogenase family)
MIALITGVSRKEGLGFSVARSLAKKDFTVIITARDEQKVHVLANILKKEGLDVESRSLDVTSDKSIENIRQYVAERYGSIDVIINNAVAGFDFNATTMQVDIKTIRIAFETNVIGPWCVLNAFLPLLQKSTHPRVVNVSSEASSFGMQRGLHNPYAHGTLSAYSASKSALNAYTVKLAQSLKGTDILVNAVDPGFTATHPELDNQELARSADKSARGIVWAATLPSNGPTGGFFRDGQPIDW